MLSATIIQDLKFDHKNGVHYLDALRKDIDVGSYIFSFEVCHLLLIIKICFLCRSSFDQFMFLSSWWSCRLFFMIQSTKWSMPLEEEQKYPYTLQELLKLIMQIFLYLTVILGTLKLVKSIFFPFISFSSLLDIHFKEVTFLIIGCSFYHFLHILVILLSMSLVELISVSGRWYCQFKIRNIHIHFSLFSSCS